MKAPSQLAREAEDRPTLPSGPGAGRREDLGPVGLGPLPEQAHLADFSIPRGGLFAGARSFVTPRTAAAH